MPGDPLTFLAVSQAWIFARSLTPSLPLAYSLTALVTAVGQEVPNAAAHETVYHMPLAGVSALGVSALVWVGWLGMIALTAWLTHQLSRRG